MRKFIVNELEQLDIPRDSRAYRIILDNALEAADVFTRKELKQYIQECFETLPNSLFY